MPSGIYYRRDKEFLGVYSELQIRRRNTDRPRRLAQGFNCAD